MVELLRHRQTKGAATDMFYLTPPRHISTLPIASIRRGRSHFRFSPDNSHRADIAGCFKRATGDIPKTSDVASWLAANFVAGHVTSDILRCGVRSLCRLRILV